MAATRCLAWPTPPVLTSRSMRIVTVFWWDAESDVFLQGRWPISRHYSGFGELDEKPRWDGDPAGDQPWQHLAHEMPRRNGGVSGRQR